MRRRCLPAFVGSDPRSDVDFWTNGRGPNTLHRSTPPPTPPAAVSPMSILLLEELKLTSEPVLLNQDLHKHTNRVWTWPGYRFSVFIPFSGQEGQTLKQDLDQRTVNTQWVWVCVCVPALLLWGAVWCGRWSGLGGGVLPLFSGLHALDLQFLNSNSKTGFCLQ